MKKMSTPRLICLPIQRMSMVCLLVIALLSISSCKKQTDKYVNDGQVVKSAVSDIDGNVYDAVYIGNALWMQQNLRTTKYADGIAIEMDTTAGHYFQPGCREEQLEQYGLLYNWTAAVRGSKGSVGTHKCRGVCPAGWHLPSDAEWKSMLTHAAEKYDSGHTPSPAIDNCLGWAASNTALATILSGGDNENDWLGVEGAVGVAADCGNAKHNASKFSALPAGYYTGGPNDCAWRADFWSSTKGNMTETSIYVYILQADKCGVQRTCTYKDRACAVRCVKD